MIITVLIPNADGTPHDPCDCCSRIIRNGEPGHATARYAWTGGNGHTTLLCVNCCALWRQNALEDPELAPVSIRELAVL